MSIQRLHASASAPRRNRGRGFTLLEMAMTAAVLGLITAIAVPGYAHVVEKQKITQCTMDLHEFAVRIERYWMRHGSIPNSLADLGPPLPKDPWGRDYQFLNFESAKPGHIRKDHNLHPLNSEFDLYSLGKDGRSVPPLTGKSSRDDVIWARDGGFVGLAADY